MMRARAKIILSVSNDLNSDQRLQKVCQSLQNAGYDPVLIGRYLKGRSKSINRPYSTRRFKLWFKKGPLFYLNLNLRLLWYLLFAKYDLLIANDLDTLPANYLVAKFRKKPLVYDAHEYFTEVPELIDRPKIQGIWKSIEKWILPKINYAYTVSPSIARAYEDLYGLQMGLVRNFPTKKESKSIPKKQQVVIYQGALNVGRGLEELIRAFNVSVLADVELWIFGAGDIEKELKKLTNELALQKQITFFGRKAPAELGSYTERAALGVSLEHPMGLSYQFAIPNKVFDYLQAGTAVLYAPLKEIELLLDGKDVGEKLRSHEPEALALQIKGMLDSEQLKVWQANAREVAKEYCWKHEEEVLLQIVEKALNG